MELLWGVGLVAKAEMTALGILVCCVQANRIFVGSLENCDGTKRNFSHIIRSFTETEETCKALSAYLNNHSVLAFCILKIILQFKTFNLVSNMVQISVLYVMGGRETSGKMFLYMEPWRRGGSRTASIPHRDCQ